MTAPADATMISDLNATLVRKALQEPTFRAALLADPRAAVEQAIGGSLPASLALSVVEATANHFTIVLPYQAAAGPDGELSDADLEAVAGGSKDGAKAFFNDVGDYIKNNPLGFSSYAAGALGGVATGGTGAAAIIGACQGASAGSGQK